MTLRTWSSNMLIRRAVGEPLLKFKWLCQIMMQYFQHALVRRREAAESRVTRGPRERGTSRVDKRVTKLVCRRFVPHDTPRCPDWLLMWFFIKRSLCESDPWLTLTPPLLRSRAIKRGWLAFGRCPRQRWRLDGGWAAAMGGSTLSVLW